MQNEDFDKLKTFYSDLIECVSIAKETDSEDENMDCFLKMFQIVKECLKFSPCKDTDKTCKQIGAINKQKEKVKNSLILKEYNREYKRVYGLHYNHPKKFSDAKFEKWSKKAKELRNSYDDSQIEEFKMELKKLSEK